MQHSTFLAYSLEKTVRVKAQPCRPALKQTVPLSGYTCEVHDNVAVIGGSCCLDI